MASTIHRLVHLVVIFILGVTGFGSALRVVTKPQTYSDATKELSISCVADGPKFQGQTILSIVFTRRDEGETIASIDIKNQLKYGAGRHDNIEAQGHINKGGGLGYLTLTIRNPGVEDSGMYQCKMLYTGDDSQIGEKDVFGNVTHQGV